MVFGPFRKIFRVMDSLSTRHDLFPAHKDVVGVGVLLIAWIRHGVKWADSQRVLVQDVEISSVLQME